MHFSNVISATLFAVLATAAPISYDQANIAAVAQGFKEFAERTESEALNAKEQLQSLATTSNGDLANVRKTVTVIAPATGLH